MVLIGTMIFSVFVLTFSSASVQKIAEGQNTDEVNKIIGSTNNVRIVSGGGNDINFAAEGKRDATIISQGGNDFNNATFNQGNVRIISGPGEDDNLVGINGGDTTVDSGSGDDRNLVSRNEGNTRLFSGPGNDENTIADETSQGSIVDCGPGEDKVTLVGPSNPKISKNCETIHRIQ